ncbi:hypothetical protein PR048_028166 [Dryococelus australis]|uniref:Uncharacterized protein n=1 Tax=Dryococelus australis TaxID=614101 RepID=A0ABQ9GII5_9NEOP|nr:hypothetical protein PR048_028166 [Dryococelus australis]
MRPTVLETASAVYTTHYGKQPAPSPTRLRALREPKSLPSIPKVGKLQSAVPQATGSILDLWNVNKASARALTAALVPSKKEWLHHANEYYRVWDFSPLHWKNGWEACGATSAYTYRKRLL